MKGRTVIVTGATRGIGRAAAESFAAAGATTVLVSRDPDRTRSAALEIAASTGSPTLSVAADFSRFDSVRAAADDILRQCPRVDVLVNNAGAIYERREVTSDGFEKTWQVDYLSPFLFTVSLAGALTAAAPSRVVNVASDAHLAAWRGLDFDDLELERGWSPFRAYSRAKLANIMFSAELARRWAHLSIASNAVHPGTVRTGFGKTDWNRPTWYSPFRRFWRAPEKGAETVVHVGVSPDVEGTSGLYFYDLKAKQPSAAARDRAAQSRLFDATASALGLSDDPSIVGHAELTP